MILILDDTEYLRKRFDIEFLFDDKYKQVCQLIDKKPYSREIMQLAQNLTNFIMVCHHRSIKILKEEGNNSSDEDISKMKENFIRKIDATKIARIEFGRDMHTNFSAKTIDKNLFYANLKYFIDFYILNNMLELKILYYGENYKEIEKMTLIDKVIDEIRSLDISKFKDNRLILDGLKSLFPSTNPFDIIENWRKKEFSKKEIIHIFNENL